MSEADASQAAGKYLTFRLGDESYGLQILKVQEILGMMPVTRVPRTPNFIRGVVNLRGKVIPVVDLRCTFNLAALNDTETTCIIVVQIVRDQNTVVMGVIVDAVSEVLDVRAEQVEPAPAFGTEIDTAFILGMGKIADKVVILLDIDRVLSTEQLSTVNQTAA